MKKDPIPRLPSVEGWEKEVIQNSCEPLVSLHRLRVDRLEVFPLYRYQGIPGALSTCYVREMVMNMLLMASNRLPSGYKLLLFDGWRPHVVQTHLFQRYVSKRKAESHDESFAVSTANPSIFLPNLNPLHPSPHLTGGSVDVGILDDKGKMLDMGCEVGSHAYSASTRYYEKKLAFNRLSQEELPFLENRRLLYAVMTSVGFTNCQEAWWHYDFGNQLWSKQTGKHAFYGAISLT